jgi:murein DD-endopeptidase MepM/ murein hydrolase activator NlpD
MTKKKPILITLIAVVCVALTIVILGMATSNTISKAVQQATEPVVRYEYGLPIDSFRIDTFTVKEGETLGGMLNRLGATKKQITGITLMPRSEFDVRTIRPGKTYYALYQTDTAGIEQLEYYIYLQSIREAVVLHLTDSMHVERFEKEVTHQERSAEVVIESSLWNAMANNNLPTELALELSDIYAWTIDFFGLQKGDSIRVYYDELYVDSTRIGIGRIWAADFYHARKWQEAYWFEHESTHNYFDAEGNSLRKAFLKAPLNYKRISSGFTYARKHPIYKTVRPHTGVDYAAPTGTPVVSIGDGKVIMKEYKGGGGHTVKIKHNSTYTTGYLHLSKYAKNLKVGQYVKQGEVIGYVGSSGASTGPHLDFRVWKNGSPIDPLKMQSPPAEPIPTQYKDTFQTKVAEYRKKLSNK